MIILVAKPNAIHGSFHHHRADSAQRNPVDVGNRDGLGPQAEARSRRQARKPGRQDRAETLGQSGRFSLHDSDRNHADRYPDGYLLGRHAGPELRESARANSSARGAFGGDRSGNHRSHGHLSDADFGRAGSQANRHELLGTRSQARGSADELAVENRAAVRLAAVEKHGRHASHTGYQYGRRKQGNRGRDQGDHSGRRRRRRDRRGRAGHRRARVQPERSQRWIDHDPPQRHGMARHERHLRPGRGHRQEQPVQHLPRSRRQPRLDRRSSPPQGPVRPARRTRIHAVAGDAPRAVHTREPERVQRARPDAPALAAGTAW